MNYIYDLYVNFQKQYYDFYEWNKNDKITHIKKIPIFLIKEPSLKNIIRNENKIDLHFLEEIKDKAELFPYNKKITACLFTDKKDVVATLISNKGIIIKKSALLFEEEYDVLKNISYGILKDINIHTINKEKKDFLTRNEKSRKNYILRNIPKMDDKKIFYLYFECFNKEETNRRTVEMKLKQEIIKNNDKICLVTYNFLKLIYT
jgi:hypothetical protein